MNWIEYTEKELIGDYISIDDDICNLEDVLEFLYNNTEVKELDNGKYLIMEF